MPPEKKKRKYTFRKGQLIPYESGSIIHKSVKAEREVAKILGTKKRKAKKAS